MANTDTLVTNMTSVDLENVCTSYILYLYSCYTAKESHTKICKFGYIVYHILCSLYQYNRFLNGLVLVNLDIPILNSDADKQKYPNLNCNNSILLFFH